MLDRRAFIAGAAGLSTLPFIGHFAYAAGDDARKNAKRGGTLSVVVTPEPNLLVSAFNSAGSTAIVSTKVMEGLIAYDQQLNMHPYLAKAWEWSDDGLSLTFHLQENVKWHDGVPFTSKDVAFTLMQVWRELHSYGRTAFANVTAVDTPDDHTAILRLSAPAKYIMGMFSAIHCQLLPAHLYEGTDVRTNPHNNTPIGTGPFKFKEWVKGSHVSLVRNDDYWREDEPYLDGIICRFIPDAGARLVAFKSGEVHIGYNNAVPINELKSMDESADYVVTTDGGEYTAPIFMHELNLRRAPFDNVKVRRAILHAINREALVRIVWGGHGDVATGPIPKTTPQYYKADTVQYPYDPKRAEELLDEAGYPRGKDGIRFTMTHDFLPFGSDLQRSAEFTKQELSKVGIKVEVRAQDYASYMRRVYTDYDFDMTNTYMSTMPDPVLGVQRVYWSKSIVPGVPYSNASGYNNPEMDALWEIAQTEVDDGKRRDAFFKIQDIAQRDLPVLDLFEKKTVTVASAKVKNFSTTAYSPYTSMGVVYLEA